MTIGDLAPLSPGERAALRGEVNDLNDDRYFASLSRASEQLFEAR